MHQPAVLAVVPLLMAAALPAQKPTAGPPLLIRQHLVAADTLQTIRSLGLPGYAREAQWLYGSTYVLGDATIDTATGELLGTTTTGVFLRGADGKVRWNAANADTHADPAGPAERRLLFADRIVLPRAGGGLVGLDRKTGALAWQRDDVPNAFVVADGDLLVTAGPRDGKPALAVLAVANGAPSCNIALPEAPTRLVPGPQGVALVFAARVAVHDRTGPVLFAKDTAAGDLVAAPDGWFARVGDRLECWSRTGDVRWQQANVCAQFEQQRLCASPAGDLVVATFMPMADSGVALRCLAAADGALQWAFRDDGLGVDHSKYWHRVQVRVFGDRMLVTSQAAGGNFALRFDPRDGGDLLRQKFAF